MTEDRRTSGQRHQRSAHADGAANRPLHPISGGHAPARDQIIHELERSGHHVVGGRLRCPSPDHEDRTPSAYAHPDDRGGHVHCYGCGRHWDLVDVLTEIRGMTMREALEHVGRASDRTAPKRRRTLRPPASVKECPKEPLQQHIVDTHQRRAAKLDRVPAAFHSRGLTLEDCHLLQVAAEGEDAIFPIWGPDGATLRLKKRLHHPMKSGGKYLYVDVASGTPAWCSPTVRTADLVLVIEGELNGAVAWRARPELGVVGVAGVSGCLPFDALRGRTVVVYTDADEVGRRARERWAAAAHQHGAASVLTLDPWPDGDACDVAGAHGLAELARRIS
ncbi:MAG: CHC2 zinc finger domain-containing protein [bacterium]|nr:CHC2 zinc finger domain-containing protein [bacterium]